MPLVFPAEIAFVAMVAAFGAFLLLRTETMWLRPLVQALQHPHGSWWKRVVLKPLAVVATATLFVEKHVRLALSHFASGSLHMLTRWFNGLGASVHHFVKEVGDIAPDWADSFAWFRHRTMPREITKKTAPIKLAAAHAGALAGRSISLGKALRIRTGRSIDRLNRKMGLLAGILLGIDILVKGRHAAHHHRDHAQTIPRIRDTDIPRLRSRTTAHGKTLARHGTRIKRLEKALAGVLTGAAITAYLLRRFPWMGCRNFRALSRRLNCVHFGFLNDLLALTIDALLLRDLCRIVGVVQAVAIRVEPLILGLVNEIEGFVCGGRESAPSAIVASDWQRVSRLPSAV